MYCIAFCVVLFVLSFCVVFLGCVVLCCVASVVSCFEFCDGDDSDSDSDESMMMIILFNLFDYLVLKEISPFQPR